MIPNFHDAEDILQIVAMVIAIKFLEYDQSRSFTQWALGIARNKVMVYSRNNKTKNRILNTVLIDKITEAYEQMSPHLSVVHEAQRKSMKKMRKLLKMWYVDEQEADEIACLVGIAKSTIYVILHRVRRALKQCIRRQLAAIGEI